MLFAFRKSSHSHTVQESESKKIEQHFRQAFVCTVLTCVTRSLWVLLRYLHSPYMFNYPGSFPSVIANTALPNTHPSCNMSWHSPAMLAFKLIFYLWTWPGVPDPVYKHICCATSAVNNSIICMHTLAIRGHNTIYHVYTWEKHKNPIPCIIHSKYS